MYTSSFLFYHVWERNTHIHTHCFSQKYPIQCSKLSASIRPSFAFYLWMYQSVWVNVYLPFILYSVRHRYIFFVVVLYAIIVVVVAAAATFVFISVLLTPFGRTTDSAIIISDIESHLHADDIVMIIIVMVVSTTSFDDNDVGLLSPSYFSALPPLHTVFRSYRSGLSDFFIAPPSTRMDSTSYIHTFHSSTTWSFSSLRILAW